MRFGLFYQVPAAPTQTDGGRYRETIEQIRHADRLGFATAWLAEGHFRRVFSIVPSPLLLAAALAPITERIRLGTASIQLPLHHPLRVAEEAAMVDLLSGGRLELGVGRGSSAELAEAFGQEWDSRDERFLEGVAILLQAWADGRVSYEGAHYRHADLTIVPRPLQPSPPLLITANHPEMASQTGALGLGLLMGAAIHPLPEAFFAHLERYRVAFDPRPGGRARAWAGAVFWVFPGRDLADVEARIGASLASNHIGARHTFAEIARTFGIFGAPDDCVAQIAALQERAELDELICHFNPGGLVPHDQVLAAMTTFAEQVMPHFQPAATPIEPASTAAPA